MPTSTLRNPSFHPSSNIATTPRLCAQIQNLICVNGSRLLIDTCALSHNSYRPSSHHQPTTTNIALLYPLVLRTIIALYSVAEATKPEPLGKQQFRFYPTMASSGSAPPGRAQQSPLASQRDGETQGTSSAGQRFGGPMFPLSYKEGLYQWVCFLSSYNCPRDYSGSCIDILR